MDKAFFQGFNTDLRNERLWKEFHTTFRNSKKKLKDVANPTQLGDHVSLKAEAARSSPTNRDRGAQSPPTFTRQPSENQDKGSDRPWLSKFAKDTTIGDPVSIEPEEVAQNVTTETSSPNKHSTVSSPPSPPEATSTLEQVPPIPEIDGESLFWSMMARSRKPDPYIFPALLRLEKLSAKQKPILAALSNTVIFPPDHPYNRLSDTPESDPRSHFDVFVASADVGIRKPDMAIYKLALDRLDKFDKNNGGDGVKPEDCVFLDDIGENLKTARNLGMKTIKVMLGKTWRAVKELEYVMGTELMDDKTRHSKL